MVRETGGTSTPNYNMLVNGAKKVLTALDWLGEPNHYPIKLIDSVLKQWPRSDGCHIVDAVYVLYRCYLVSEHRKSKVNSYLLNCLQMIKGHEQPRGGGFLLFSGAGAEMVLRVSGVDRT